MRPTVQFVGYKGKLSKVFDRSSLGVITDLDKGLLDIGKRAFHAHPHPQVSVISRPERLVVSADLKRDILAVHHGRIGERTYHEPDFLDFFIGLEEPHDFFLAVVIEKTDP